MSRQKAETERARQIKRALRCCPAGYPYRDFLVVCGIFGARPADENTYRTLHKKLHGVTPAEARKQRGVVIKRVGKRYIEVQVSSE